MGTNRVPPAVLVGVCVLFVFVVAQTTGLLPERVATHFAGDGTPNGWMSRQYYARFIILFGLGTALFPVLLGQFMRVLPSWTFNVPNREYWLGPSQRRETVAWLQSHMCWLGAALAGMVAAIHWMTVTANLSPGSRLDTSGMVVLLVAFASATITWSVVLLRRFRKPPDRPAA